MLVASSARRSRRLSSAAHDRTSTQSAALALHPSPHAARGDARVARGSLPHMRGELARAAPARMGGRAQRHVAAVAAFPMRSCILRFKGTPRRRRVSELQPAPSRARAAAQAARRRKGAALPFAAAAVFAAPVQWQRALAARHARGCCPITQHARRRVRGRVSPRGTCRQHTQRGCGRAYGSAKKRLSSCVAKEQLCSLCKASARHQAAGRGLRRCSGQPAAPGLFALPCQRSAGRRLRVMATPSSSRLALLLL